MLRVVTCHACSCSVFCTIAHRHSCQVGDAELELQIDVFEEEANLDNTDLHDRFKDMEVRGADAAGCDAMW
jgi:hypothetical protein